jgi:hypothetical protein
MDGHYPLSGGGWRSAIKSIDVSYPLNGGSGRVWARTWWRCFGRCGCLVMGSGCSRYACVGLGSIGGRPGNAQGTQA